MSASTSTTHDQIAALVERVWQADILPALHEYIAIACVSVMYDPQWAEHGHLHRAIELIEPGGVTVSAVDTGSGR